MLSSVQKSDIILKFGKSAKNTGSTEVQIAVLTARIKDITEHLKSNPKDFSGRRGLLVLVGKRSGLLKYLKSKDIERYKAVISALEIRG